MEFISQGHAEDVIAWHRYNYYVLGVGLMSDGEYDLLEGRVSALWPVSVVTHGEPGSDLAGDYPLYVRERRRPDTEERRARDEVIVKRWLDNL